MSGGIFVSIIATLFIGAGLCAWFAFHHGVKKGSQNGHDQEKNIDHKSNTVDKNAHTPTMSEQAKLHAEQVFNDEFREELKNRGRLHFEKIINENAMFLQQDLRLTTSQINDYMKQEIKKTLETEFSKYEQSINDAKQLAVESIEKTKTAIEQQRTILEEQLQSTVSVEKERLIKRFEENMSDIVNHYVLQAVGSELDLNNQLEFIIGYLEENKEAILQDIRSGA